MFRFRRPVADSSEFKAFERVEITSCGFLLDFGLRVKILAKASSVTGWGKLLFGEIGR